MKDNTIIKNKNQEIKNSEILKLITKEITNSDIFKLISQKYKIQKFSNYLHKN